MKRRFEDENILKSLGEVWNLAWITIAPMLLGLLLGQYLDKRHPLGFSWTLSLLALGALFGFYNLYDTLMKASKEMEKKKRKGNDDKGTP